MSTDTLDSQNNMQSNTQNKVFKLTKFCPIGFKLPNYPIDMCLLCRGKLTEICNTCQEKQCEVCPVVKKEEIDYHTHCLSFVNKSEPPKVNNNFDLGDINDEGDDDEGNDDENEDD